MTFLRTVSTRRLLALIAAAVIVAAGGTAIAIAAAGNGPVPPPASLAAAIHQALGARPADGVSARVSFTDNLIDSSLVQSSDPLITGASGRLWASRGHLRIELQSDNGDAQIVVDNGSFWIYDPTSNTVYEGSLPANDSSGLGMGRAGAGAAGTDRSHAIPTVAQIQSDLGKLVAHLSIHGAIPTDFGGAAAYAVRISPRQNGGLLGAVGLAWDAVHGVPLDFALYAKGDSTPVLELKVTSISFGPVAASDYMISPPPGATVVPLGTHAGNAGSSSTSSAAKATAHHSRAVTGTTAVARHVNFTLAAPATLAGMTQGSVKLVKIGRSPGALLLYGHGLGGIAVFEHAAKAARSGAPGPGGIGGGLSLPTVSVNGVSATELPTALGTVIQFTRGGVDYIVAGSVPSSVAVAAARDL